MPPMPEPMTMTSNVLLDDLAVIPRHLLFFLVYLPTIPVTNFSLVQPTTLDRKQIVTFKPMSYISQILFAAYARAHWRANNVSESGEAHCQACLPRIPANRNMAAMIKITEPVLTISRGVSPGVFLET